MTRLRKQFTYVGMALLTALVSCSQTEDLPSAGGAGAERAALRVAGASSVGGGVVLTRADDRKTLTEGSIGVFLKADAGAGYDAVSNLLFTYGTPLWQTDEQILLGAAPATLAAYYPYAAGKTNPLLMRSQKFSDAEDLCYTDFRASKDAPTVKLDLNRIYSRIVFNFTVSYPSTLQSLKMQGEGVIPVAFLDMFELTADKSVRDLLDPFTGVYGIEIKDIGLSCTSAAKGVVDCLMIPYKLDGDFSFTVKLNGEPMTGTVAATDLVGADSILREGVKYVINVTIEKGFLHVTSLKKMPWDAVDLEGDYVIQ